MTVSKKINVVISKRFRHNPQPIKKLHMRRQKSSFCKAVDWWLCNRTWTR